MPEDILYDIYLIQKCCSWEKATELFTMLLYKVIDRFPDKKDQREMIFKLTKKIIPKDFWYITKQKIDNEMYESLVNFINYWFTKAKWLK